ncbi:MULTISPECIES: hypothetical protein [unclassified Serratia (in: enterobacteria)]|nr:MULTISPECIES: hypothetical protein [unclassified Serratia (in: enterobacteria)]
MKNQAFIAYFCYVSSDKGGQQLMDEKQRKVLAAGLAQGLTISIPSGISE